MLFYFVSFYALREFMTALGTDPTQRLPDAGSSLLLRPADAVLADRPGLVRPVRHLHPGLAVPPPADSRLAGR